MDMDRRGLNVLEEICEIILICLVVSVHFHLRFTQDRRVILILVTVYINMNMEFKFNNSCEVPPWESQTAAMSPSDTYSSTSACQTWSML